MNKRIFALIFAVLLCIVSIVPAFAADEETFRYIDQAEIVDDSLDVELLSKLDEISERQQFDVVVLTIDTLEGATIEAAADDFFDYLGYGYGDNLDGALLLVARDERQWHISTSGYGITALTDYGIEYIGEQMTSDLSDGDYYSAFVTYAELCDEFVTMAKNGEPFDIGTAPKTPFNVFKNLLISLVVGLVLALIVTLIMKSQLKSVRMQNAAANYEKPGSMMVTDSREYFLYSNVNREKKADNNGGSSTHTSSSGNTHGGGGGSF